MYVHRLKSKNIGEMKGDCLACGPTTLYVSKRYENGKPQYACIGRDRDKKLRINTPLTREWYNERFSSTKRNASKRGIIFDLTKDELVSILSQENCFYCNTPFPKGKIARDKDKWQTQLFRSLDRVNNKLGYTKDNCVLACLSCNTLKGRITKDDFERVTRIMAKLI